MNRYPIDNRTAFLQKIRTSLKRPPGFSRNFDEIFADSGRCQFNIPPASEKDHHFSPPPSGVRPGGGPETNPPTQNKKHLLNRLIDEAVPLNLKVIPVPTASAAAHSIVELTVARTPEWSEEKSLVAWKHPLIDSLNLPDQLKSTGIPLDVPGDGASDFEWFRNRCQTALIGVTSAEYCIVESASLILKTRPGQPRMVSLLPSIHVAVITEDRLIERLSECYAQVQQEIDTGAEGLTCCMTLISGPSKTADIEAVMVHGAHGPREMIIYVICDS
jgi:L-lactate dehydrogenase complex protein LldG